MFVLVVDLCVIEGLVWWWCGVVDFGVELCEDVVWGWVVKDD